MWHEMTRQRRYLRLSNFASALSFCAMLVPRPGLANPLDGLEAINASTDWLSIAGCEKNCAVEALIMPALPRSEVTAPQQHCLDDVLPGRVHDDHDRTHFGLFVYAKAYWLDEGQRFERAYRLFLESDPSADLVCIPDSAVVGNFLIHFEPELAGELPARSPTVADQDALAPESSNRNIPEGAWTAALDEILEGRDSSWALRTLFSSRVEETVRVRIESIPEGAAIQSGKSKLRFRTNSVLTMSVASIPDLKLVLGQRTLSVASCDRQSGFAPIHIVYRCRFPEPSRNP
ncbi:hypothetical protein GRI89_03255 [Altererythrobacter salegens]|uniref:Uncharacterized protein n=1 Tax=Croceibacterium salegens TaxID=1737568 RepID=A0A6I4SSN4_9SPHN|nr:hypothetical protein [Croceibacterium salegens]